MDLAPPAGLEPTRLASEASALSAELRGRTETLEERQFDGPFPLQYGPTHATAVTGIEIADYINKRHSGTTGPCKPLLMCAATSKLLPAWEACRT